ncbi:uncharacterized protein LACBIDRAFT_326597 [Laccaria bicolor S238N-H82]|uniref:Predicted protein n=1 Tax=Laccaria bicolor (strain S238N-H82 / ATCC MYA-4686) TaxID=486041 RepID=B0D959_LACBS|nr:uncharacterized protein LACBIDRAFT_326597 [Laccaria bicolor S238N-H82]EDR09196.1 predicted protein [Laccaria bicolor S238N-H82]|eukprot:XP_001880509.1 predicted protein [Laccaria bicolor S238N-H82]
MDNNARTVRSYKRNSHHHPLNELLNPELRKCKKGLESNGPPTVLHPPECSRSQSPAMLSFPKVCQVTNLTLSSGRRPLVDARPELSVIVLHDCDWNGEIVLLLQGVNYKSTTWGTMSRLLRHRRAACVYWMTFRSDPSS